MLGEIAISIMENDDALVGQRRQLIADRGVHLANQFGRGLRIGGVGCRIFGIRCAKAGRDGRHPKRGILRVQPGMRIIAGMVVIVIVVMFATVIMPVIMLLLFVTAQMRAFDFQQSQLLRLWAKQFCRAVQPGRQLWSGPDQRVRFLQCARIRGAHLVMMDAGAGGQQDMNLTKVTHHLLNQ